MQTQLRANGSSAGKWAKVFLGLAFAPSLLMPFFVPLVPQTVKAEESGYRCSDSFKEVTPGSPLQVFEEPDIGTRNLGELPEGTQVLRTLRDRSHLFSHVEIQGRRQGWVLALRLAPLPSTVRQFNGFLEVKTIDGNPVNLREYPSRRAKVLSKVPAGNVVRLGHQEGEWSYVTDSSGASGYMVNHYLVCTTAKFRLLDGPDRR